ncbi:MAG: hypothetical protein ACE366_11745 [Bradymonadia bacterium]
MRRGRLRFYVCTALTALALSACDAGDATLEEVDPEAAPANPTWSSHVERIMVVRCTACHAEDAQSGEAEGYGYETCEKTIRNWEGFVETVVEEKTMPPGGADRLTSAELLTMQRWYEQGAPCD